MKKNPGIRWDDGKKKEKTTKITKMVKEDKKKDKIKYIFIGIAIGIVIGILVFYLLMSFGFIRPFFFGGARGFMRPDGGFPRPGMMTTTTII